jgi:WD40 repeat protein
LCTFLAIIASQAQAGSILGLLSSHSGKLAKYEFTLNDSFPVTSVAWSPDGRYIASSSSQDNRIHICDVQDNAPSPGSKNLNSATRGRLLRSFATALSSGRQL